MWSVKINDATSSVVEDTPCPDLFSRDVRFSCDTRRCTPLLLPQTRLGGISNFQGSFIQFTEMDDFYMQQTRVLEDDMAKMRSLINEVTAMKGNNPVTLYRPLPPWHTHSNRVNFFSSQEFLVL